jgi:DNA-binding CsgD family transcriptional regulator
MSDTVELDSLSDLEKRALRLLSEGHTAKSIAAATGCTPAAVNERLRQARRKTGVGSSRELARILRTQENRHEQIDLVGNGDLDEATEANPRNARKGLLAMLLLLTIGLGALVVHDQNPTSASALTQVEDPLLNGAFSETGRSARQLHAQLRRETRDAKWADGMEAQLRARYSVIPQLWSTGLRPRITCATTLCEIAGIVDLPTSDLARREVVAAEWNASLTKLQSGEINRDIAALGLKSAAGLFTPAQGGKAVVFAIYWSRSK